MMKHANQKPIEKHELRDDNGNLLIRGSLKQCQDRIVELTGDTDANLPTGWTLLPYIIERWAA